MTLKEKYKQQLGMDTGTAQNRLVKDLLFKFIQDMNLNKCFHCGTSMDRETFTIEHKIPWRNASNANEIFFDLDNISFSHFKCNSAARRNNGITLTKEEQKIRRKENRKRRYDKYMANRTDEQKIRDKQKRKERYQKNGN